MSFSYSVSVEVTNPNTQALEEWALGVQAEEARPENRRGHPDNWSPAEGGEIEFTTATHRGIVMDFTDFVSSYNVDGKEIDTWYELAQSSYDDAAADAADNEESDRADYLADRDDL